MSKTTEELWELVNTRLPTAEARGLRVTDPDSFTFTRTSARLLRVQSIATDSIQDSPERVEALLGEARDLMGDQIEADTGGTIWQHVAYLYLARIFAAWGRTADAAASLVVCLASAHRGSGYAVAALSLAQDLGLDLEELMRESGNGGAA